MRDVPEMAQQGGMGGRGGRTGRQMGQRPLTIESVAKIAAVATLIVGALDLVVIILQNGVRSNAGSVDIVEVAGQQVIDVVGQGALFGAVVAAYVGPDTRDFLLKLAGIVFVADIIEAVLNNVWSNAMNSFTTSLDFGPVLVGALFPVTTLLGFVMVMRLFEGKTILPDVNWRL